MSPIHFTVLSQSPEPRQDLASSMSKAQLTVLSMESIAAALAQCPMPPMAR